MATNEPPSYFDQRLDELVIFIRANQAPSPKDHMTPFAKAARTIAGLYNHAKPLGMGRFTFAPGKMTPDDALNMARTNIGGVCRMDYLRGRVIKCSVDINTGEVHGERLYDRDNGAGAFAQAIAAGLADPYYAELDAVES